MRLQRLDLIRFGHFTDKVVELPKSQTDFHILFGPNEAGKSTALTAIEDLLFGIPTQSPFGFVHDYGDMRIGAVLESGSAALEVVRRKGNKDTLLDTNGLPISGGDGALATFLKGVDRTFFERMFSLDHTRLEKGGQDILKAKDDVGQMLFSAGAGIAGLRDQLTTLRQEADTLWAAKRAKHRLFYQAQDALKDADADIRKHVLSAAKWRELKGDYDKAKDAYLEAHKAFRDCSSKGSRLNRIRRIYNDVQRKQQIDRDIAKLGAVVPLPADASTVFEAAERGVSTANSLIETYSEQLKQAQAERNDLAFDEPLILRADDVAQLHERRIQVAKERAALPNREADLRREEETLREHAAELGWTEDDITALAAKIPGRSSVGVVRALLNQRSGVSAEVANKTDALKEAKQSLSDLEETLRQLEDSADASELAAIIRSIREKGDLAGSVRDAERELKQSQRHLERLLGSLRPRVGGEKELFEFEVPSRASVQSHGELMQAWQVRNEETQRQISTLERSVDKLKANRERIVASEDAITPEALTEMREHRDILWRLIRRKHIENIPLSEEESASCADSIDNLADAFEPAITKADHLADRRYETAEATARIAEISRSINQQADELRDQNETKNALAEQGEQLTAAWTALWKHAPFEPLDPGAMLTWLDTREQLAATVEARDNAADELETSQTVETEARNRLAQSLAALNFDTSVFEGKAIGEVLELAFDEQRQLEGKAMRKAQLETEINDAEKNVSLRQQQLDKANEAETAWRESWTTAVLGLGLTPEALPETVSAQVDVIDLMRETLGRIDDLRRNRIDKIIRDIEAFEKAVAALVEQVADDLKGKPADYGMLEIEARLETARRFKDLSDSKDRDIESLEEKISKTTENRDKAAASVNYLKEAASADTDDALREAIEASDRLRELLSERAGLLEKLIREGDGLTVEELEKDCIGIDIDEVSAQIALLENELENLHQQHTDAAEAQRIAKQSFEAVGGDDAAAQAAASRQEALADIRAVSERYVRVRTSALLLQWAIDRYRQEKHAPLLKRAGELFATLTDGSFERFTVVFDEHDQPGLAGVRHSGKTVPVSGMSTGTADQLFLALRVGAIEDYLGRTEAMPFVADDLFINFDDERAAAGFKILGQLAKKTQVLFFTHHQHLLDIARETLGESINTVALNEQTASEAA